MTLSRACCGIVLLTAVLVSVGCAPKHLTIADAIPDAASASPWVLDGEVWSGSLAEAADALGPDADEWRPFSPSRVWLAVYRHQYEPENKLTLRAFAFDTPDAARNAYERFKPPSAADFRAGDEGCWTGIGVLFVWGRLVFDIFGEEASQKNEVQSALLAGLVIKRMPAGLPDDPR